MKNLIVFVMSVMSIFLFSTNADAQFRKVYEQVITVDQYDPITEEQVIEDCPRYKIDYGPLFLMAGQELGIGDSLRAVVYAFKVGENQKTSYKKVYKFAQRKEKKSGFLPGLQGLEIMSNNTPVGFPFGRIVGFGDPGANMVPCLVYDNNSITRVAMLGQDGRWRKGYYFLLLYKL